MGKRRLKGPTDAELAKMAEDRAAREEEERRHRRQLRDYEWWEWETARQVESEMARPSKIKEGERYDRTD